jgi:hypothetical protein
VTVKPNCSRLQKAGSANVELIGSGQRPVQRGARVTLLVIRAIPLFVVRVIETTRPVS